MLWQCSEIKGRGEGCRVGRVYDITNAEKVDVPTLSEVTGWGSS